MRGLKIKFLFLFVLLVAQSKAQDSLQLMSLSDFYRIVLTCHPLAKQAATLPDAARSQIRMARGAFDPVLKSDYDEKELAGEDYWKIWQSKLEIPVWLGADLKVAYDNSTGKYLDNSVLTPDGGLSYVGFTMPLGQGLLIDQRRATLKQAKLSAELADADKISMINKLLLQAAKDYWDWTFTYNKFLLHEESLRLALVRFNAIRDRVLFGDLPAIDSLEAFIEVQNRQTILAQSAMEYNNARLIASNNLWNEAAEPLETTAAVIPALEAQDMEAISSEQLALLLKLSMENHPELLKLNLKIDYLTIERKLAAEKLRPKLNFDYNLLRSGDQPWNSDEWATENNYKYGFNFSFPLFLREERGKLGFTKIKIQQTNFDRQQRSREIKTQVQTSWNELVALKEQMTVQESQVQNSTKMLDGEQYRFNNGEGSIFLINTRENNLINSRIKLIELKTKFAKSKAFLYWAAGRFQ